MKLDRHRMRAKGTETLYRRTWFGVNARVTIGPGFLHKTGFNSLVIPHPPMANWLLRQGLPGQLRRNLTFAHEFAHFQTAPMLLVYMLAVIVLAYVKGRTGIVGIIFFLVSSQAAWELMSEGLVVFEDSAVYHASYHRIAALPRILFWVVGGMLAAAGWVTLLHS